MLYDKDVVCYYICYPIEHFYRNPRYELRRFFDDKHPNHYKVFNFCCEPGRGYSEEVYGGAVERYPFRDHCAPPMETMIYFANSIKHWLDDDFENVITLHCKAGKGRAGLMACVAMFRTGMFPTMEDCMNHYDRVRVDNNRGLTVRTQRRYALMFERIWREVWGIKDNIGHSPAEQRVGELYPIPSMPELSLVSLEIRSLPEDFREGLRLRLFQGTNFEPIRLDNHDGLAADGLGNLHVELVGKFRGNFKISLQYSTGTKMKKSFELWHNTFFTDIGNEGLVEFNEEHCDIKRRKRKYYQESNFSLTLHFNPDHCVYKDGEYGSRDADYISPNEVLPVFARESKETEMTSLGVDSEDEIMSPGSAIGLTLVDHEQEKKFSF